MYPQVSNLTNPNCVCIPSLESRGSFILNYDPVYIR